MPVVSLSILLAIGGIPSQRTPYTVPRRTRVSAGRGSSLGWGCEASMDPLRPRSPNPGRILVPPRLEYVEERCTAFAAKGCRRWQEGLTATPQAFMGAQDHQPWQDHRGGGGQDKNSWLLTPVTGDASAAVRHCPEILTRKESVRQ